MGVYLSPGVYTREIDVSTYPASVSTAICGLVGTATKGPVNIATYITNPQQFIDTFGNPTVDSYLGYASLAFLEKGNQLYVTRVGATVGPDALEKATRDIVSGTQSANTAGLAGPYTLTGDSFDIIANGGARQTIYWSTTPATVDELVTLINQQAKGFNAVASAGALKLTSNAVGTLSTLEILRIDNTPFTFPNLTKATITGVAAETFNITATNKYLKVKINSGAEVTVTLSEGATRTAIQVAGDINSALSPYGAGSHAAGVNVVIDSNESGSGTSIELMTITSSAYTTLGLNVGSVSGTSTIAAGVNGIPNVMTINAVNEGTWGNDLYVAIENRADGTFDLAVFYLGVQVERFDQLKRGSVNATDDNYVEKIVNVQSQYIDVVDNAIQTGNPHDISPLSSSGKLSSGKNGINGVSDADYNLLGYNFVVGRPEDQIFEDAAWLVDEGVTEIGKAAPWTLDRILLTEALIEIARGGD